MTTMSNGIRALAIVTIVTIAGRADAQTPVRTQRTEVTAAPTRAVDLIRVKMDSIQRLIDTQPLNSPERPRLVATYDSLFKSLASSMMPASTDVRATIIVKMPNSPVSDEIARLIQRDMAEGRRALEAAMPKGWIGFYAVGPMTQQFRNEGMFIRYFDYPTITTVDPQSPADSAGIEEGDRLIRYNGLDVRENEVNLTKMLEPSKHVSVSVRRDNETREFTLEVAPAPAATTRTRADQVQALMQMSTSLASGPSQGQVFISPAQPPRAGGGFGQVGAMPATRALVRNLNVLWGAELSALGNSAGIVVLNVPSESPASKLGFKITDVIVKVAGVPVTTLAELHLQVERQAAAKYEVEIKRDGKTKKIEVKR